MRSGTRAAEPRASEVGANWSHFKLKGRMQKDTAVTDAEGIIGVVMLLQGQQAARVRRPISGGPQGAEGSKFCALSRTLLHFGKGFEFLRVFSNLLAHFGKGFNSGAKGVRPGGRNALNPKRTLFFLKPEREFSIRVQFRAPKAQKGFGQAQIGFGQA